MPIATSPHPDICQVRRVYPTPSKKPQFPSSLIDCRYAVKFTCSFAIFSFRRIFRRCVSTVSGEIPSACAISFDVISFRISRQIRISVGVKLPASCVNGSTSDNAIRFNDSSILSTIGFPDAADISFNRCSNGITVWLICVTIVWIASRFSACTLFTTSFSTGNRLVQQRFVQPSAASAVRCCTWLSRCDWYSRTCRRNDRFSSARSIASDRIDKSSIGFTK